MYNFALLVTTDRWFFPYGSIKKSTRINMQIQDERGKLLAIKSFYNVTPAQAARAVALQNKLAGMK